jgi:hypothetical protein
MSGRIDSVLMSRRREQYPRLSRQAPAEQRREQRLRRTPMILASALGVPLLAAGLFFSYQFGEVLGLLIQLNASFGQMLSVLVFALLGPLGLIAWIICLLVARRRQTVRWRMWWSAGALLAAAACPVTVLIIGFAGFGG